MIARGGDAEGVLFVPLNKGMVFEGPASQRPTSALICWWLVDGALADASTSAVGASAAVVGPAAMSSSEAAGASEALDILAVSSEARKYKGGDI